MVASRTSLLKEALFLTVLGAMVRVVSVGLADAPTGSKLMLGVLAVQMCFHVLMSVRCVRCNPRKESFIGCNAIAMAFGVAYLVYFSQRRAAGAAGSSAGLCVGLFIVLSHLFYVPIDELLLRASGAERRVEKTPGHTAQMRGK